MSAGYQNVNGAVLLFAHGRWVACLQDDPGAFLYVGGWGGREPPEGEWFNEAGSDACTVKIAPGPLITREKADELLKYIEAERRMKREV